MSKAKNGASESARSLPTDGGGLNSTGEGFRPNLAMGGGTYRVPLELPKGPGNLAPKVELLYNTSQGTGMFGIGWSSTFAFIEAKREKVLRPEEAGTMPEFSLMGAEDLVAISEGHFLPEMSESYQPFELHDNVWESKALNGLVTRFGGQVGSRVSGEIDGQEKTWRWYIDRITAPGGQEVNFTYDMHLGVAYPTQITWSVYSLHFNYEERPDPWSNYSAGFEVRTERRCTSIELHNATYDAGPLMRRWDLSYEQAPLTGHSLLASVQITGFNTTGAVSQPPITLGYTSFDRSDIRIEKTKSTVSPPPRLGNSTTVVDIGGSGLPGVLSFTRDSARYWPNLGDGQWGGAQEINPLPAALKTDNNAIQFLDMNGSGTADLLVGTGTSGGGFYPNAPLSGFTPKRALRQVPMFTLEAQETRYVDLDGDAIADMVTVKNGVALGVLNQEGEGWSTPVALDMPTSRPVALHDERLSFADFNGDGGSDLLLLEYDAVRVWPFLGQGKWGTERLVSIPEGLEPRADAESRTYFADVTGNGCVDLIELGSSEIRIWINQWGEALADPITLPRSPLLLGSQTLLMDILGTGVASLVWNQEYGNSHEYWYLATLGHQKPYLLNSIDNGRGLQTRITYSTSTQEKTRDLNAGNSLSTFLPFVVQVVSDVQTTDEVRQTTDRQRFEFHNGHFDHRSRRWLGFAHTDVFHDGDLHQRSLHRVEYFHNQPEVEPWSRGQPYRIEHRDGETDALLKQEITQWDAKSLEGVEQTAYITVKDFEQIEVLHNTTVSSSDQRQWEFDDYGRVIRLQHDGHWNQLDGTLQHRGSEELTQYATGPDTAPTNLISEKAVRDLDGRLLELERRYYDGPVDVGLPFGQAQHGWLTRVQVAVLNQALLTQVYGGTLPVLLASEYTAEMHAIYGNIYWVDKERVERDVLGNVIGRRRPSGARTEIAYDAQGLWPTRVTLHDGSFQEFQYDPVAGQIAWERDFNGNERRVVYDGLGEILEVYLPGASPTLPTEQYEREEHTVPNQVIKRVRINHDDSVATWVQYEYFDGHRQSHQKRTEAENGMWAVGRPKIYNARHMVVEKLDGWFSNSSAWEATPPSTMSTTHIYYDALGRPIREEFPNSGEILHFYEGNIEKVYNAIDSVALSSDPITSPSRIIVTDNQQQSVEVQEDMLAQPVRRHYDGKHRLVRMTDALGHTIMSMVFDLRGSRIYEISAEAGALTRLRDRDDNEILVTDARGLSVYSAYDGFSRVVEVRNDGPAGDLQESYIYDSGTGDNLVGRLARAEGVFGSAEYSYTPSGKQTQIRRNFPGHPDTLTTNFSYNAQDKVTSLTYPSGETKTYSYNSGGLINSVSDILDTVEYDASGRITALFYTAGVTTRVEFSSGLGLVKRLETFNRSSGDHYQHLLHHYDAGGRVAAIDDLSNVAGKMRNNQTYDYDAQDRLIFATGRSPTGNYTFEYSYDALGNLIENGESFTEQLRYGYQEGDIQSPNRLVKTASASDPEWIYDAAGNITQSPEQGNMQYDHRGRLVRIEKGSDVSEFVYDHEGQRVIIRSTTSEGSHEEFNVDGLYKVRSDGSTLTVYWDGKRKLGEKESGSAGVLFHVDRLGNINVFSAMDSGAFAGHVEYTPYGRMSLMIAIAPHYGFQSACHSQRTGLVHLQTRYYSPTIGRFLSADRYLLERPQELPDLVVAWNFYAYSGCNPVNYTDASGRFFFLLAAAAAIMAYIIIGIIIAAVVVGVIAGIVGAAVNGAETWDEWLLSIVAGVVGALGVTLLGLALGGPIAAIVMLGIFAGLSIIGTPIAKALDDSDSEVAWGFSFVIKLFNSPVLTILGLFVTIGYAAAGNDVQLRRGTLFVNAGGTGRNGITLGAIAYVQGGHWTGGNIDTDVADHEAYHSRQVLAFGEIGFYLTYLIVGTVWGAIEAGTPFATDVITGCGNPFEKTARTFNHTPATPTPTGSC